MYKNSGFCTSSPKLDIVHLFNFGHFDECMMTSYYEFNIHLHHPDDLNTADYSWEY